MTIQAGAKLEAKDRTGNTPLHLAAKLRRSELVIELLAKGADPNAENRAEETPFSIAKKNRDDKLVEILEKRVMTSEHFRKKLK